jgi:hypothetical protein
MLVFIVPLKSKKTSKSWNLVCQLFERTLRSICNQTSSCFSVIVVCHEKPNIDFRSSQVTYICVDFESPCENIQGDTEENRVKVRDCDKNRKIFTGLLHAKKLNPSHIMIVDADDLVSNQLANFVSQNKNSYGWFLKSGYQYKTKSKFLLLRKNDFYLKSGTSYIIKSNLLDSDLYLDLDIIDENFLHHQNIPNFMKKRGFPLVPLPFEGAIYMTETGENVWAQSSNFWKRKITIQSLLRFYGGKVSQFFKIKPLTKKIRDEFGMYEISNDR